MEAIVAVYSDWGIGCGGTQPVVVKADRKHFRTVTGSAAVIVGRRTLSDFPGGKPLPGRHNIVLTRSLAEVPGAEIVRTPAQAAEAAGRHERCFVIGGASVYRQTFPWLDLVYVTQIDACPESDSFFPNLDADPDWAVTEDGPWQVEDGLRYRFRTYERRSAAADHP